MSSRQKKAKTRNHPLSSPSSPPTTTRSFQTFCTNPSAASSRFIAMLLCNIVSLAAQRSSACDKTKQSQSNLSFLPATLPRKERHSIAESMLALRLNMFSKEKWKPHKFLQLIQRILFDLLDSEMHKLGFSSISLSPLRQSIRLNMSVVAAVNTGLRSISEISEGCSSPPPRANAQATETPKTEETKKEKPESLKEEKLATKKEERKTQTKANQSETLSRSSSNSIFNTEASTSLSNLVFSHCHNNNAVGTTDSSGNLTIAESLTDMVAGVATQQKLSIASLSLTEDSTDSGLATCNMTVTRTMFLLLDNLLVRSGTTSAPTLQRLVCVTFDEEGAMTTSTTVTYGPTGMLQSSLSDNVIMTTSMKGWRMTPTVSIAKCAWDQLRG
ncbi:hypothetical protein BLNAU_3934 [Blattamonas nauphoetae]|uniref:Uncharacterized protein n=1 Tax=Blattamonas nauphoetae TaxID=2049346 RepID=A0ABQ9YBL8_9EUKA|nr:hypothetical protein BLNAU_3934 [Blattamonas nauphoetae]